MAHIINDQEALSISIALANLYQIVVLVEDGDSLCRVMEWEKDLDHFAINDGDAFSVLCDNVYKNIHPEDREEFLILSGHDKIHDALSKEIHISAECRIRHSDSGYYWSRITICNAKVENSPDGREYLFLIQDIHESKAKELQAASETLLALYTLQTKYDELFQENMTDSLTGCYNRKGFKYYETATIEEAKEAGKSLFVCVIDLNGLKHLNDTYGHEAGDIGIRTVADALRASVPEGAKIIRTGGDELLVFAALDSNSKEPEEMGERLIRYLKDYNDTHDHPFDVAASFGYIFEPIDVSVSSLEKYIEIADEKMYRMKEETDPYKR